MTDHELHTLTGAYAADALDPEERVAFEQHLAGCASCRQETAELTATTARLGAATSAAPPAALRDRVLAEVAHTRQLSPLGSVPSLAQARRARPWYRQPATIAAALLLVVAAGLGVLAVSESRSADRARTLAERVAAVAADPQRVQRTVAVSSGGTGTVVSAHGLAVFRAVGLAPLPAGQTYQLWRITGQDSQSAGVLGRGGDVTAVVKDVAPGDAIGLTVEPSGGSARPTTKPVFLVSMA